jgi:hypothetical protein
MTDPYDSGKSDGEQDDLELASETVEDLEADDGDAVRGGAPRRCSNLDSGCL